MQDQLERLAEAGAAGDRDLILLTLEIERLRAREDAAHDLDVLACAGEWLAIWLAMPAFDDLRAGEAEAEQHAPAAEHIERSGGHRGVGGGARRHLQNTCAEFD